MKNTRELTPIEKQFVKEAEENYFTVDYNENGDPCAVGADHNSNCFSMQVAENPDGDGGAVYWIKE